MAGASEPPLIDPRHGDVEDDVSSPKQRSLLAIAGSLLAEISLPKLLFAFIFSIVVPGLLLGLAPLVASAWLLKLSTTAAQMTGLGAAFVLMAVVAAGWFGWRPLLAAAERNFWSLNALAIQPAYTFSREGLRYLAEGMLRTDASNTTRARLRALSSAAAAIVLSIIALAIAAGAWPGTRWVGTAADLLDVRGMILPMLANAVVIVFAYLAAAALVWGFADALMPQPVDLGGYDSESGGPTWRVAHLSDIHLVGERYGFRIESGRSGARGNERWREILARLDEVHGASPLDIILITGDLTDAGRSAEWAEFFAALEAYPRLAELVIALPGNHDVNVVDRASPARMDLPTSPMKRLRQVRTISALGMLQGSRLHVVESSADKLGGTLADALKWHGGEMAAFADNGSLRLSRSLAGLWATIFPMVMPPATDNGLGVIVLNSNAETHFSFTNALGLVSAEQARGLSAAVGQYPRACWIVALHHHVIEYPKPAKALSERIGTALINGSWFIRRLQHLASHAVIMHGHRHIDWIGECGGLLIVSAPSPVMAPIDCQETYFYVHTLAVGADERLKLLAPERINVRNQPVADEAWV